MVQNEWLPIPDFPGYYANTDGRVGSTLRTGKIKPMKPQLRDGTPYLTLHGKDKIYHKSVKLLVASTFIPNPEDDTFVLVKDGDQNNTAVSNLEWSAGANNQSKTVYQYDENWNLVKSYGCVKKAADEVHVTPAAIGNACCGRSITCCGYRWSYKSPEEDPKPKYREITYAHWYEDHNGRQYCSSCHKYAITDEEVPDSSTDFTFCPHCGAIMIGD